MRRSRKGATVLEWAIICAIVLILLYEVGCGGSIAYLVSHLAN